MRRWLTKRHAPGMWRAFGEGALWLALFAAVGYLSDSSDPLFVQRDVFALTAFLSVVTLYYGIQTGVFVLALTGVLMAWAYTPFALTLFLKESILVFIWGSFAFYRLHHVHLAQSESEIYQKRLRELSNAFYALKVSHDQLELNYVLRPVSLRKTLEEIVQCFEKEGRCFAALHTLLSKAFRITHMSIVTLEAGEYVVQHASAQSKPFDRDDPLVKQALLSKAPVYISSNPSQKTPYLAVIPAVSHADDEVKGLVLIEKMPFLSFNQDTITFVMFVFEYVINEIERDAMLAKSTTLRAFSRAFRFEVLRLKSLYDRYGIDSSLVVFSVDTPLHAYRIYEALKRRHRMLDRLDSIERGGKHHVVMLLPFSVVSSAHAVRERTEEKLKEELEIVPQSEVFSLSQSELFEAYIGDAP